MIPVRLTEKFVQAEISFHESQAQWFSDHGQETLARWARSVVELWRQKLETMTK